ncbi:hypothetical protein B0T19DRAFT_397345 [Cercophora scortea]|uniref:Uncharacterized protein n=1 Tax=Cercophora scortea TaxID=314031 RepID=A0AAE0J741_9PEZI|nr:hypothetical protein B0T19DRAFT_397345 [Cercophora scortea]
MPPELKIKYKDFCKLPLWHTCLASIVLRGWWHHYATTTVTINMHVCNCTHFPDNDPHDPNSNLNPDPYKRHWVRLVQEWADLHTRLRLHAGLRDEEEAELRATFDHEARVASADVYEIGEQKAAERGPRFLRLHRCAERWKTRFSGAYWACHDEFVEREQEVEREIVSLRMVEIQAYVQVRQRLLEKYREYMCAQCYANMLKATEGLRKTLGSGRVRKVKGKKDASMELQGHDEDTHARSRRLCS